MINVLAIFGQTNYKFEFWIRGKRLKTANRKSCELRIFYRTLRSSCSKNYLMKRVRSASVGTNLPNGSPETVTQSRGYHNFTRTILMEFVKKFKKYYTDTRYILLSCIVRKIKNFFS